MINTKWTYRDRVALASYIGHMQHRIEMYRRLVPWPALIQSLQLDLDKAIKERDARRSDPD